MLGCWQITLISPLLRPTCYLGDGDLAAASALPSLAEGLDLDDVVLVDRQWQLQGGAVGLHHTGPAVFVLAVHHLRCRGGEEQCEVYSQGLTITRTDPTMACWTTSGQGVVAIWEDLEMYWLCSCCISGCLSQLCDSLEVQTISFVNSRICTGKNNREDVGGWVVKRL